MRTIGVLMMLSLVGCNKSTPAVAAVPPKPTAISIVAPERGVIRRVIEQPGVIQADEETQLMAKLPGYVQRVFVDIGQHVSGPKFDMHSNEAGGGQVLAILAVPEMEQEAKQKQAMIVRALAEVEQGRKGVIAAEANVATKESLAEEARASHAKAQAQVDRWQSEAVRVAELVAARVMDAQTRDETINQLNGAVANLGEAKAKVISAEAAIRKARADHGKAEADVKAMEASVEVSRADARRVEALLGYAMIRAPYSGVVTARKVNTGDFVAANGERAWLFTVARIDKVRVVVQVPEADAGLIKEKMPVELTIAALRSPAVNGTIARTSWSLQPGSRTLRTEIDLLNGDERFRPGMYVTAKIRADLPAEWTLPVAAIKTGSDPHCFLVQNGKAVRIPVQVGRSDGQRVELLKVRRSDAAEWSDPTSADRVAMPAAGLVSGQQLDTVATVGRQTP